MSAAKVAFATWLTLFVAFLPGAWKEATGDKDLQPRLLFAPLVAATSASIAGVCLSGIVALWLWALR